MSQIPSATPRCPVHPVLEASPPSPLATAARLSFALAAARRIALRATLLCLLTFCALGGAQAQTLSSLTVTPAGPTGGDYVSGRVILTAAAPANGLTVTLSSSLPGVASVPASVTVSAGQTQGYFTVTTTPVATDTPLTLSATDGTTTKTAAMTVYAPQALWFWVSPNTLVGGGAVNGTVILDGPAPAGGLTLHVTSSNPAAAIASDEGAGAIPLVVPAGWTSVTFSIRTSTVNYAMRVTFTEAGSGLTADLFLQPTNLHVVGLLPPNVVQLAWDAQQTTQYHLYRAVYPPSAATNWTLVATLDGSALAYDDAFSFVPGTAYVYVLTGDQAVQYSADIVQPYFVSATANQAVDSRLDLRYSTNVLLDRSFGGGIYRGGLFAGMAADPSRVGRSFARFAFDAQPPHTLPFFRLGSIAAYLTKAYTTGQSAVTMQVGCQPLNDATWDALSLKWSTAPAADPSAASSFATVQYNPSAPLSQWLQWPMGEAIRQASSSQTPLAVAWTSRNEGSYGWAYFAKKEFDPTKAPTACYAWCGPTVLSVTLSPATIVSGQLTTATINVNGIGPGDSVPIYIWCDQLSEGVNYTCPATLTLTGMNRTFTVGAVATTGEGQMQIHASLFPRNTYPTNNAYFRWFATAQLTISSSGGGGGVGGDVPAGPAP